ncbi:prepilin-type N-terminal cleavage/methylation domain-containing protein [Maricaulis sp.]|uniref:prepilin-type N-terminal cleavage/methylation domain-containing protein n=1 Tax=Maricaulis sp. TaxID=1486257 RepID=UPI001B08617E|nr:prepilin-type N-terminal cleavage/methylation domain-containing protein [Maricaulis sp.]MBO6797774.1 prepilin-type N-terminal cleavage/methylation domain-containing protein [Maricaulis sp.]
MTSLAVSRGECRGEQAGVTLVEVLAVLVIVALATSLVVPRLVANSTARNMDRHAEILVADLRRANIEARALASPIFVDVDEDGYSIELLSIERDWGPEIQASWRVRRGAAWQAVSRLELTGRRLGRKEVLIRLQRDDLTREVRIEPLTGRVSFDPE